MPMNNIFPMSAALRAVQDRVDFENIGEEEKRELGDMAFYAMYFARAAGLNDERAFNQCGIATVAAFNYGYSKGKEQGDD